MLQTESSYILQPNKTTKIQSEYDKLDKLREAFNFGIFQ